jgi:hypothetical protein
MGEFVEEKLTLFRAGMRGEDLAAEFAEVGEPGTEILGQLLVNLAAKSLGKGGAFSGSGNGDLEVAAGDDGAEEEIAIGNIVNAVAEDVALEGSGVYGLVDDGRVCCGDDDEIAVEVGEIEGALDDGELAFLCELADFRTNLRRDYVETETGLKERADLLEGHVACADQQTGTAFEFEEDGEKRQSAAPSFQLSALGYQFILLRALFVQSHPSQKREGWGTQCFFVLVTRCSSVAYTVGGGGGGQIAFYGGDGFSG